MFLYVHENSDDFHVIFPSLQHREVCYQCIVDMMKEVDTDCRYSDDSFINVKPNVVHVRKKRTLSF